MQIVFLKWREKLQENAGGKSQLKRCNSPEEAALHPETHRLKGMLPNWVSLELVATIAGLSAHIRGENKAGFIESLATPKEKNGRIPFSESRFRQMLLSRDWNELYRNLRRAISILDGSVSFISFINTVFLWNDEFREAYKRPGNGVKYRLSRLYYETAMKYEK